MLGRYVSKYLQSKYKINEINRVDLDAEKSTKETILDVFNKREFKKDDVVINCIGMIKPQVDKLGPVAAIKVNSIFPRLLADSIEFLQGRLIHITTDCVWDGASGNYDENFPHNALDVYGKSKSLGEPENCTVLRTSIIGEEVSNSRSLVEWVKSNKNGSANGFTNHFWNGVTCLELAKFIENNFLIKNNYWQGVRHVFSNTVNKLQLLNFINNSYQLNINITPIEFPVSCDRSMSSIYDISSYQIQDLEKQIEEMSNFSNNLL